MDRFIKKGLEEIVQDKKGKVVVDWKRFNEYEEPRAYTLAADVYRAAVDKLEELEILSLKMAGNYYLSGCEVLLNPRHYFSLLYFTRDEDAVAYKKAVYSNAQYHVSIVKVASVK